MNRLDVREPLAELDRKAVCGAMPEGNVETKVITDPAITKLIPGGWWIEKTGAWYRGYFGETQNTDFSTSILKVVDACWFAHNGTGAPVNKTRLGHTRKQVDANPMRQRTLDELL